MPSPDSMQLRFLPSSLVQATMGVSLLLPNALSEASHVSLQRVRRVTVQSAVSSNGDHKTAFHRRCQQSTSTHPSKRRRCHVTTVHTGRAHLICTAARVPLESTSFQTLSTSMKTTSKACLLQAITACCSGQCVIRTHDNITGLNVQ